MATSTKVPAPVEVAAENALRHGAPGMTRLYVWDPVVRLTHWAIALSMIVLSVTGIYIGTPFIVVPGEAHAHFVMGTMRAIHFWAAIVFGIAVPSRLWWMLVANNYFGRWHQFIPVSRIRLEQMWGTLKFYLFLQRTPPEGMYGHNPLAGSAYFVVYLMELVMVLTGLAMYGMFAVDSPFAMFTRLLPLFGGAVWARWIHHVLMWLLLGFFVHHFYSALLTSMIEKNGTLESIFSGVEVVPHPEEPQVNGNDRIDLLILGLGNLLCGDDGVGIAAIECLERQWEAPDGVRVLDGGTLGMSLMPWLQDADRVIIVDAIAADGPPGSLVRLEGKDVAHAAAHRLSVHQIGVADLLDGVSLLGQTPSVLVLYGVVPESMELTVELSPRVAAALPDLVDQVVAEAVALGFPLRRREAA